VIVLRIAVFSAALLAALAILEPASGATSCATRVLRDWSDDGQVASRYSPPCYEEAIDALPTDLRDYTNAQDVITRALTQAVRKSDANRTEGASALAAPRAGGVDRSPPLALVAVAVAAVTLLCGGVVGCLLRRLRPEDAVDDARS
jgi:hypothetical protein